MAKFNLIKKGQNADLKFWFLIEKEDKNGFSATALVKNKKDISKGNSIELPDGMEKQLKWQF